MPAGGERLQTVHGRIPGTALDRRVRVAGGTLTSLRSSLDKVKRNLEETVRLREAEIAVLEERMATAEAEYKAALAEKREKEPGTFTVPGLLRRSGPPPGLSQEEWIKKRQSGEHLEYLSE